MMKKFCILLTAFVLILCALAGCAAKKAEPQATPAPTAAAENNGAEEGTLSISPKPKTVTTDMTELTLLILNNTGKTYSTDYVQKLERSVDGAWQEVPLLTDAVPLTLLTIPSGGMTEYVFDFVNHYEKLENGTYRIVKIFVDDAGNKVSADCEFDLF